MSTSKHFSFKLCALVISSFFVAKIYATDSLSYSGRLVKTDGSPVTGPVDLRVELVYSNATASVLCSQDLNNTVLSNGVFYLKLTLNCGSNGTLEEVLLAVPGGESAAIRVTDLTHSKTYSLQAMHAMPFSNVAGTAKQLVQMGATNNQILKWNDTLKKWEPGNAGGSGTVTGVSGTAPISVTAGAAPVVSMAQANTTTSGYLSSADWNTFNNKESSLPTGGTTLQYFRGNKTLATLDTSVVPENVANLYFTNARVLGVPLDGFVPGAGAIAATDTVLNAFNKTQGQINALGTASGNYLIKNSSDTLSGTVTITNVITASGAGDIVVNSVPLTVTSAVNKSYADRKLDKTTGGVVAGVVTLDNDLNIKGGSNYVTLRGHATSATYNLILPSSAGANGNVLKTDGAGNLSWIDPASVVSGTGTVDSASIVDGTIVNADVSATAAIAQSKIANLTTDLAAKQSTTLSNGNILVGNGSNVASPVAVSGDATLANTGALTLANSGVAANTYTSVTVDAKGRVTGGTNPTTLAGYGITDPIVTGVSVTAPITNTGTAAVPLIGMPAATTLVNGYLTAADWTIFNNKQAAITAASNITTATVSSGELRLNELAVNGTNYVALKAPDALASNVVYTLPLADGSAGQVLKTDGAGVLSWVADNSGAGAFTGAINRVVTTDGAGALTTSGTTSTEIGYVSGVTSSIQTQLNAKQASGNYVTALTGDVTATGPGSVAATVAQVGGVTAANVATGANLANAATNLNTASTIVKRDASGNFTAGTITATLNGTATNVSGTVAVANGGTGATTLGLNQLLFGNGTGVIGTLATTATPSVLLSAVTTGAPTWTTSTAGNVLKGSVTGVQFGALTQSDLPAGSLSGAGTVNYVPYYNTTNTLANSPIAVSGTSVGIGTATPGAKLEVAGQIKITGGTPGVGKILTSDAAGLATWETAAGGSDNLGNHTATANIILGSNYLSGDGGNEGIRVDASGNVGVGTTSPSSPLTVRGTILSLAAADPGAAVAAPFISAQASSGFSSNPAYSFWYQSTTGISNPANNQIGIITNGTERIRLDSSGNVGIGMTSPGSALDVKGTLRLSGATSGYVGFAPAAAAGSTTYTLPSADGSAGQILKTNGSGVLSWVTDNSGAGAFTGTVSRAVATDGAGALTTSATTSTELGYVSGVTSSIQTQLNAKQASGNYVTALTGDVTGTGPGSVAATVAQVGGVTAANVATGANLANAATNLNTASTIVKRDASGNFTAGTITATLNGNATNVTGVVAVPNGGTGKSTLGLNNLLFGNTTGAIGEVASTTTPSVLLSANATGLPTWTTSTTGNVLKGSATGVQFGALAQSDLPAGSLSGAGTVNYVPYYTAASTLGNSPIAISGSNVGIGTTAPTSILDINGAATMRGMAAPAVSPASQGRIYFDSTANKYKVSQNGGAYTDLVSSGTGDFKADGTVNMTGTLKAAAGSETLPSLTFAGDPDTGIYNSFANVMAISSAGTKVAQFGPAGATIYGSSSDVYGSGASVSMGATNTSAGISMVQLQSSTLYGQLIANTSGATSNGIVTSSVGLSADMLTFATNSAERMRITTTGNVGIGTTAPGSTLDVKGTLRLSGSTSGYVGFVPAAAAGSTTYTLPSADGSAGQILKTNGAGVLSWVTDSTGAGAFSGTASRAVATDGVGALTTSATTSTELGYVSGVTSSIQTQLNAKEPTITAGSAAQYLKGNKSLGTFLTDVMNSLLTGVSFATNSAIVAGDNLLVALGKLQAQISAQSTASSNYLVKNGTDTISGTVTLTNVITATGAGDVVVNSVPLTMTSAVNKTYADGKLDKTTGGTVAGVVTLDNDLKIKGGSNYVTIRGHATSAAYNLIFPANAGSSGNVLSTDGSGNLFWASGSGDFKADGSVAMTGQLLGKVAAAPGYSFSGDTNTGLASSSADTLDLMVGGVNALHVDVSSISSNKDIDSMLSGAYHLENNFASDPANPTYSFVGNTTTGMFGAGANILGLSTASTERMRIDATGKVGIGGMASNYKLEVIENLNNTHGIWVKNTSTGTSAASHIALSVGTAAAGNIGAFGTGSSADLASRFGLYTQTAGTGISISARNAGQDIRMFTGGTTERMRIDSAGNVGIGTISPQYNMHLNSSTVSVMSLLTNSATGATASDGSYVGVGSSRDLYLWNQEAASIKLGTNDLDRVTILSDGKVGIGTVSPTYQLQLSTDSAAKPGTSTWTIASDSRLKDVRAPFNRGLDSILGINPIYYKYKKNNPLNLPSDKEYVGILAQNAKELIPESVSTDEQGFLHLNNDSIIWTLLNAVKELHQRFTTSSIKERREIASVSERTRKLEVDNAAKDRKIKDLEKENADFKRRLVNIEKAMRLK